MATNNVADVIGPFAAAGNFTYTLTCTGAGGAAPPGFANRVGWYESC